MTDSVQGRENPILFINGKSLWDAYLSGFSVDELRELRELARKIKGQGPVAAMSVVIAGRIPSGSSLWIR